MNFSRTGPRRLVFSARRTGKGGAWLRGATPRAVSGTTCRAAGQAGPGIAGSAVAAPFVFLGRIGVPGIHMRRRYSSRMESMDGRDLPARP